MALTPGALVEGSDGSFYGTTCGGGTDGEGTVFKITTNGVLDTIVSFVGASGAPFAGLVVGRDGNFYGTTQVGGTFGAGTVFRVTTNGGLTTLIDFADYGLNEAEEALVLGSDGCLYGTTLSGSGIANVGGSVFRLDLLAHSIETVEATNGAVLIRVFGTAGQRYTVHATTNMIGGMWQSISTNIAGEDHYFQFLDSEAGNYSRRYYRTSTQ